MINVWQKLFADDDYSTVEAATMAAMKNLTGGFPPSPGDIANTIKQARAADPDGLSAEDAWALVLKATSNGIHGAIEEYNRLPKEVQACLATPMVIKTLAVSENPTDISVEKSRFVKVYEARRKQQMDVDILPGSTRTQLGYVGNGLTKAVEAPQSNALPSAYGEVANRELSPKPSKDELRAFFGSLPGMRSVGE